MGQMRSCYKFLLQAISPAEEPMLNLVPNSEKSRHENRIPVNTTAICWTRRSLAFSKGFFELLTSTDPFPYVASEAQVASHLSRKPWWWATVKPSEILSFNDNVSDSFTVGLGTRLGANVAMQQHFKELGLEPTTVMKQQKTRKCHRLHRLHKHVFKIHVFYFRNLT